MPGFVTLGEYEWADERMPAGLAIKNARPLMPLSALGCPADGHFVPLEDKIELLALYLKKAAHYRLPANDSFNGPVQLNALDVRKTGWLVERYATGKNLSAPAAPVGEFKGDETKAFWYFDGELAKAVEAFQQKQRGKPALLGYVQEGKTLPETPGAHHQITLKFLPEADGVTFTLHGTFLDTVPKGRPERWAGKKAGSPIEPPHTTIPITIRTICGPVEQVTDDTWRVAFNRASFLGDSRGNEAWFAAVWPGDGSFKRAIQQSMLPLPRRLSEGAPPKIVFPKIADPRVGARTLALKAMSDSGLPVRFFVREGPAEVEGGALTFTDLPPKTKFPVKLTVVAYQYGRMAEPKIQSAEPVVQELYLAR